MLIHHHNNECFYTFVLKKMHILQRPINVSGIGIKFNLQNSVKFGFVFEMSGSVVGFFPNYQNGLFSSEKQK